MAKSYLTREELEAYSTVEDLLYQSASCDLANWGLCTNGVESMFRTENDEWKLHLPLAKIIQSTECWCEAVGHGNVFVIPVVEVKSGTLWCMYVSAAPGERYEPGPRIAEAPSLLPN
ncbi:MAG TPA: hypothetical protein VFS75_00575 [Candidatus Paceibacterota bacterium]|nr:hypothetical protein [Candidatus Paceibacterota bacterium]